MAGATAAEIAAVIGAPEGTVANFRHRYHVTAATGFCEFCRAKIPLDPRQVGKKKRYCSEACGVRLRKAYEMNERFDRHPACEQCGAPLGAQLERSVRYCSPTCSKRAWYERSKSNPEVRARRREAVRRYNARKAS